MGTSCAFTGHRPLRFPWGFHETDPRCAALKAVLCCEIKALHQAGVKAFFSGMALGVDSWAAQAVLALRKEDPAVTLHCVLPCEDQDKRWSPPAQKAYREILVQADSISYVGRQYYSGCMLARNRRLVDSASILLAVYDGSPSGGTAATVRYAQQQKKEIICIEPITLEITKNRYVDLASF